MASVSDASLFATSSLVESSPAAAVDNQSALPTSFTLPAQPVCIARPCSMQDIRKPSRDRNRRILDSISAMLNKADNLHDIGVTCKLVISTPNGFLHYYDTGDTRPKKRTHLVVRHKRPTRKLQTRERLTRSQMQQLESHLINNAVPGEAFDPHDAEFMVKVATTGSETVCPTCLGQPEFAVALPCSVSEARPASDATGVPVQSDLFVAPPNHRLSSVSYGTLASFDPIDDQASPVDFDRSSSSSFGSTSSTPDQVEEVQGSLENDVFLSSTSTSFSFESSNGDQVFEYSCLFDFDQQR